MITVIDENRYDGQYDDMTLAEAGEQLIIDITESANEFQMGVLLFEHSYLYETGNEIDYLTEAEGRDNIIKRFTDWVKNKAWPAIRDFFKRAEDAIYEFFASTIPNMFAKIGLNKKKANDMYQRYRAIFPKGEVCKSITMTVDYDELTNASDLMTTDKGGMIFGSHKEGRKTVHTAGYDNRSTYGSEYNKKERKDAVKSNVKDIKDSITAKHEDGYTVKPEDLNSAISVIFNKNSILKDISKAKNKANNTLNDYIKAARSVKNDDEISNVVNMYTNEIKQNTQIYRMIVQLYTTHVSNCAKMIRFATSAVKKYSAENKDAKDKQYYYDQDDRDFSKLDADYSGNDSLVKAQQHNNWKKRGERNAEKLKQLQAEARKKQEDRQGGAFKSRMTADDLKDVAESMFFDIEY